MVCSTSPAARVMRPLTSHGSVEAARIEPICSWVCQRSATGTAAVSASSGRAGGFTRFPPRRRCGPARPPRGASASAGWRRHRRRRSRCGNRRA
ncbi:Uncharacterised protein [Bordetella pertussis]|nr:Uncharacterised protein [Bordetella pertussis]